MKIYDTKSRSKVELVPIEENHVKIYVCGPTVYNYFHIGNARPLVVFDVFRRFLEYMGYKVTFVQNFTDIDDKMIRRSNEENITLKELADKYIEAYFEDAAKLGVRKATIHPKATEHIPEIISLVEKLIEKGAAYASGGDVYFNTKAFPRYGCLCGQNLDDLESGARIEVGEDKKNPMDFTLWKAQKPGEPAWESPWGLGRPGWHIECSAMSMKYLGETFDIHCGGQDLIFPHHENEIAQAEAATGKPFAKHWMHNGFINIDNKKMSKSAGNFFTIRDILTEYDPEAVRLFLISAQYKSPLNFSEEQLTQYAATLERLYKARDDARFALQHAKDGDVDKDIISLIDEARQSFVDALNDDLNTADAIGALFEMVRVLNVEVNANTTKATLQHFIDKYKEMADVLGLISKDAKSALPEEIEAILKEREAARKSKQWSESDRLRDLLRSKGWAVEDTPQGQKVTGSGR